MKKMGTAIVSAAVILCGTFAAMLPSGVMSLLQIATIVLCGLFLYALIMLPLFIPVNETYWAGISFSYLGRRDPARVFIMDITACVETDGEERSLGKTTNDENGLLPHAVSAPCSAAGKPVQPEAGV